MMEENFRRIADAVRLPEGSRARIRAQIASRAEEQEASMQNKPKKHLPRLAVAAIIIAAAFVYTLFSIYRWNKRKGCGCGCGSSDKKCGGCDLCDGCSECSKRGRKEGRR